MLILACNVGSTSLKFKLYDMPHTAPLLHGRFERVGSRDNAVYHYHNPAAGLRETREGLCIPGYDEGIALFLSDMLDRERGVLDDIRRLEAVGFKTVLSKGHHGVHLLDDAAMAGMERYMPIAGSHNGPYRDAVNRFRGLLPGVPMVGVFETAFHTTIPPERRLYAVPYEWYERYGIQRMGYHGASHAYIARRMGERDPARTRVISCHLGGSCSLCAIQDGRSVDTSFGMSLQTGIPHANRAGDVDPYLIPFLLHEGHSMEEVLAGLAKSGGMLGLSGVSGDMRDIEQAAGAGNERAALALEVFYTAVVRYIGAYYAELGGLDALVFTGGIGENSALARQRICARLAHMGVAVDAERNRAGEAERVVSTADSPVEVLVIPTDEELIVADRTFRYIGQGAP